ncbi:MULTISPECIES: helix-turn-helix domain-containing protein [Olivibacter]|uniref:Helix-turn-helix domain-containing protein n=1 Tax=Olivibacter jilunii TaxID=985016 RepID=A0ABW6B250_9SPHI
MSDKKDFFRISVEKMAEQKNVFSNSTDLIVSKAPSLVRECPFDWKYPHLIEGIGFVLCTKGTATISINLTEYQVSEFSVGVFLPNMVIQLLDQSPDFEVGFLLFSFDFVSSIQLTKEMGMIASEVEKQPSFKLSDESFQDILILHSMIVRQYEENRSYSLDMVKSLLHTLIFQILQGYSEMEPLVNDKKQSRHEEVYKRFMVLLFKHYKTQRNVYFYADKVFLTPKHFSKAIKSVSGKTAGEWIDEMVLMEAKGMLKSSNLTVAQIADQLNFANPSFFGRYFKAKTGQTPMQYRNK